MHSLTLIIGMTAWQLLYKSKETADRATNNVLGPGELDLTDDFGHRLVCKREAVVGVMFEDMEQTKLAHVERAVHQARTQNLAQQRAQSDPALRMAMQGPAVLSPGINGGRMF